MSQAESVLNDRRAREIADWNRRMAEVQREMAERDSYSFLIDAYCEGFQESLKEGTGPGIQQVKKQAWRWVVLTLLKRRGIAVTTEQRARIEASEDIDQLFAWFAKATTCQSADELF